MKIHKRFSRWCWVTKGLILHIKISHFISQITPQNGIVNKVIRKNLYLINWGAHLVEALRSKPKGRGFDFRLCHCNFSFTYFFQFLTEINKYQEYLLRGGQRRPVRKADKLTTFMCRLSWTVRASTFWKPQGMSRPVIGIVWCVILHRTIQFQPHSKHNVSPTRKINRLILCMEMAMFVANIFRNS